MTATIARMRLLFALAGAVLAVVALVGCGGGAAATGILTGGIVEVGGPTPGTPSKIYQPGLVTVRGESGVVATKNVLPLQGYRFSLKPGFYLLQAQKGELPPDACKAAARISAGQTTRVNIICTLPS
jgi:hypothetical protein